MERIDKPVLGHSGAQDLLYERHLTECPLNSSHCQQQRQDNAQHEAHISINVVEFLYMAIVQRVKVIFKSYILDLLLSDDFGLHVKEHDN